MAFQDYSTNPAANTTIGDDVFIGPNMARNKVRPALQQIAADGKELDTYVRTVVASMEGDVPTGDLSLRADLATSGGSALIGHSGITVAQKFGLLDAKLGSQNLGALPAGSTIVTEVGQTASLHSGGTTDLRGWIEKVTIDGVNGAASGQVITRNSQLELWSSAGTINFAALWQGYARVGSAAGAVGPDVNSLRGIDLHISIRSNGGVVTDAFTCYMQGPDLDEGTSTVANFASYRSGDIGNNRITGVSYGIFQENCTVATTPILAAYGSAISYGDRRWHEYYTGGASSWRGGRLRIGGPAPATQPTDFLEVVGGIRAHTNAGTVASIGYGAGVGDVVVQATSKTNGVTLNGKPCGQITLNGSALAAGALAAFTFTNDQIGIHDDVRVWVKSGAASIGSYRVWAEGNASGARSICIENRTGGSLSEAVVLGFHIFKCTIA